MLIKCSGKYIEIYFSFKITFLFFTVLFNANPQFHSFDVC